MKLTKKTWMKLLIPQLFLLFATVANAGVSGTVFRDLPVNGTDLNKYGEKDANELGVAGVTVTGYLVDGTTAGPVTTEADGSWSLPTSGKVRVEFTNWPTYLKESVFSTVNNSSVRFAKDGEVINFALHDSAEYCNANPDMASVLMINGKETSGLKSIVKFPYSSSGILSGGGTTYNGTQIATNSDVGSVWGLAYAKNNKTLYEATFLKRHTALKGNLGDIWKSDLSTNTTQLFYTIPDAGTIASNADRGVTGGASDPSHDNQAYPQVGKMGLGDIDISSDEKYLYVINLNDKKLYTVEIDADNSPNTAPVSADVTSVVVPDPGCNNGIWRPFALKYYRDALYTGGICDGSTGSMSDVKATVYKYDGANFTLMLANVTLDYTKVSIWGEDVDSNHFSSHWHIWDDSSAHENAWPEPLLSDIEFDIDGSMILAFADRYGHQIGHKNYKYNSNDTHSEANAGGDILRACLNATGNYVLESAGSCGGVTGAGNSRNSGPDGGEFYDDRFNKNSNTKGHSETSNGAIALFSGSGQLVLNSMNPVDWTGSGSDQDYFRAGGPAWYNNSGANPGKKTRGYHLFRHRDYNAIGWAKGSGVGDLELLCPPAPVEIGNHVWLDTDADGIQDADEEGIAGVVVKLFAADGTTELANATTDANGNYIFSNDPAGASTNSHKYGIVGLTPETGYVVRIVNAIGANQQTSLEGYSLTSNDIGEGVNANSNDSDAVIVSDNADATVLATDIPSSGANNHSFDFGFVDKIFVCIGSIVWNDVNKDGIQDSTEVGIAGATVELLDENDTLAVGVPSQETNSTGIYSFCELPEGNYSVRVTPPALYIPSTTQTAIDNDDYPNDSNIKIDNGDGSYTSGKFELIGDKEPDNVNSNIVGSDDADNADDNNGNMTVDFAFYVPKVCVGSLVWNDSDDDGIQDAGETGIPSVPVELLDSTGIVIDTNVTNTSGVYSFCDLNEGNYSVRVTQPIGFAKSATQEIGDDIDNPNDSNIKTTVGNKHTSGLFEVTEDAENAPASNIANTDTEDDGDANNANLTIDFGFTPRVSIGSIVWNDVNRDGVQDATEKGIEGATVELLDCSDAVIPNVSSQTTFADGLYYFGDLKEGGYKVRVTPPALYVPSASQTTTETDAENDSNIATNDAAANTFTSACFHLINDGEPDTVDSAIPNSDDADNADDNNGNMTVDFAFYVPKVCVGSLVWNDSDDDGIQDAGETGIPSVPVELLDSTNTVIDTDVTNTSGAYSFCDLNEGNYSVRVTQPIGFVKSATQEIGDDIDNPNDSNIKTTVGNKHTSGLFEVTEDAENAPASNIANTDTEDDGDANNANLTIDFGFTPRVCVGSIIWNDVNENGTQDSIEIGIPGVTVTLLDGNGDPVANVATQETNSTGLYSFCDLPEGDYKVKITPPAGYVPTVPQTTADNDDDENDSNIASEDNGSYISGLFTVENDSEPTVDSAIPNSDDLDNGDANNANLTIDFGLVVRVCVGSLVWNDANDNGVQDSIELGIEHALVQLLDGTTLVPIAGQAVQDTNATGVYSFCGLPEGDYKVKVTPPIGYTPSATQTATDNDDSENDSNIAVDNGDGSYTSGKFTVTNNGEPTTDAAIAGTDDLDDGDADNANLTIDFGFVPRVCVGSFVWNDKNDNGMQDSDELGIAGATVELLDGNGNAVAGVASQETNSTGLYSFCDLHEGDYKIKVTPPVGYEPSVTQTTDDNDDNENDSNIASEDNGTYISGTFTVTNNTEPTTDSAIAGTDDLDNGDANNANLTIDFGFVPRVSIGSIVWNDTNNDGLQDVTETGLAGSKVELLDCSDNLIPNVASQMTGTDGLYFFDGLHEGDYKVRVTAPVDYSPSDAQTTTDDDDNANDSNIATSDLPNRIYTSGCFTLENDNEPDTVNSNIPNSDNADNGDDDNGNMTVDFGFLKFDLALIKTAGNGPFIPGGSVTFTIKVVNQGTANATDVQVVDYIPTGLILNDLNWVMVGNNAELAIPIASLAPGESKEVTITFNIDANYNQAYITNNAEIKSAVGGVDIDSTPASEDGTTPDPEDNNLANKTGGDDYDPEKILVVTPEISGNVYNDGDGDENINGTCLAKPDGTQLYVNLVGEDGNVISAKPLAADCTYKFEFDDGVRPNTCYVLVLSSTKGVAGSSAPEAELPEKWNNTGENLNDSSTGNDGIRNGITKVCVVIDDIPGIDFGINKAPETVDNKFPVEPNPGGNYCMNVPDLGYVDNEDGKPSTVIITTLPSNATLYYNNALVNPNTVITNFDNSKLCADPYDGDLVVEFNYKTRDADGVYSNVSTIEMPVVVQGTPTPTPTPTPMAVPVSTPTATPMLNTLPENVSFIGDTSAVINWKDTSNERGYKIYQNGTLIAIVGKNTTSYKVSNLTSGETYSYEVVAFNGHGDGIAQTMELTTTIPYGALTAIISSVLLN